MKLERITIPTFRKLLVIRMVANNSFGLFNRSKMSFDLGEFSCFNWSVSWGDNEKKADSAPETRADKIRRTATMMMNKTTLPSGFTISKFMMWDGGSAISI